MATLEQRMVYAHKEGKALWHACIDQEEARQIARDRWFVNSAEYDAFIAGYLGEKRRSALDYPEIHESGVS